MDTNNYNKIKPLTLTIKKHLNTTHRLWWTLGLKKGKAANFSELQKILNNLESYDSESTATFKYVVSILYDCKFVRKTKAIRESLLEFINNYSLKNNYEHEDISKYLNLNAPRYHKPWWTAWQIKIPALIAHEESILQKFRGQKPSLHNNHIKNKNNKNQKNQKNQNIENKCLTDTKILKIADDINSLSQTIYSELPKIDLKIKLEIKRISDDLKGLSNLIDILDSEVPFNVQTIKKEISDILCSLNNVIKESSSILEDKLSSTDHSINQGINNKNIENTSNNIDEINIESLSKNNNTNNALTNNTSTDKLPNDEFKKCINSTQNKIKSPKIKPQHIKINNKKISNNKDVNSNSIQWVNQNISGQITNKNIRGTNIRSYVNQELTEQLKSQKSFRSKLYSINSNSHFINPDNFTNPDNFNIANQNSPPETQKTYIDDNSVEHEIIKNQLNNEDCNEKSVAPIINNSQEDNNKEYNSEEYNSEEYNNENYKIVFSNPNTHTDDHEDNYVEVVLKPCEKTLSINNESFYIGSNQGLNKLQNYLDTSGENTQSIGLTDIITKFMYDTSLDLNQIEEYGLALS